MMSKTRLPKQNPNRPSKYDRKYRLLISNYNLSTELSGFSFKTFILLLLSILILCTFLTIQAHYTFTHSIESISIKQPSTFLSPRHRPYLVQASKPFPSNGVSLVAVCRNKHEILRSTFMSWINVANIGEVVLIDWSSSPPLQYVVEEMDIPQTSSRPTVTVVSIHNETAWVPSRAYNIGFRLSRTSTVLRVDCDQQVRADFLESHTLVAKSFFTGDDRLARTSDELGLRNILYVSRSTLLSIGGYDERIQTFEGEHEDLVHRLLKLGLRQKDLDYNAFAYIAHKKSNIVPTEESVFGIPIGNNSQYLTKLLRVETNVNLKVVNNLPVWHWNNTDEANFQYDKNHNITIPSFRHSEVKYVTFNISRKMKDLRTTIPSSLLENYVGDAIVDILSTQHYIPPCLLSPLKLNDRKTLLRAFSYAAEKQSLGSSRALFVFLDGELSSRLTLLGSALSFASQTQRLVVAYWFPLKRTETKMTSFYSMFTERNALIVIEDLPGKSTTFPNRCLTVHGTARMQYYTFLLDRKRQPLIIAQDSAHHIAVEGNTRIHSNMLHLSNDKTVRSQILDLETRPDISSRLRSLEDLHISRAAGVYVPPVSGGRTNNSKLMESFSAVHAHLSSIRKGASRIEIYADTDELFRSRLKSQEIVLLPQISVDIDFDRAEETAACFKYDLVRFLAMTRTASFFSTENDEFARFVRILRGEDY